MSAYNFVMVDFYTLTLMYFEISIKLSFEKYMHSRICKHEKSHNFGDVIMDILTPYTSGIVDFHIMTSIYFGISIKFSIHSYITL
jgi:hypothetical protein